MWVTGLPTSPTNDHGGILVEAVAAVAAVMMGPETTWSTFSDHPLATTVAPT